MKKPVFLFLLACLGCRSSTESKRLDFGKFILTVPETWRSFSAQGYDSMVGGVTDGRDTLRYDYGWYSYDFRNETTATHRRHGLKIGTRDALLVQPLQPNRGLLGLFVRVDDRNRLTLYGRDLRDEETALGICRSVAFP